MRNGWRTWGRSGGGTRAGSAGAAGPVVLALVALTVVTAVGMTRRAGRVSQPVAFNHLKHTRDLGLACDFCHPYVRSGAHAGLPGAETCGLCHQAPQGTSAEAARVTELLGRGDSLRFNKLFRLPGHVFYTHRRHAGIAGLECANCHGAIAESERPPDRPLVRVTMDVCLDCHRRTQQTLDCNACHR